MTLYPFADIDLARRLERTEARGNVQFVEARARAFPDRDATWIEVAGTYAMFDGVGSPLTQTFGMGVSEAITAEQLDTIEEFFRSRGAEVFHEVCPLADPSVWQLFRERIISRWSFRMYCIDRSASICVLRRLEMKILR